MKPTKTEREKFTKNTTYSDAGEILAPDGKIVARCYDNPGEGESMANAALFAAAPDLYTACELALSMIEAFDKRTPWQDVEPRWWLEMMEKAKVIRTALLKAKGEL